MRKIGLFLAGLLAAGLLLTAMYYLPPVHSRLAWRVANLRTKVYYALNPPEKVVFRPEEGQAQIATLVEATLLALTPSPAPTTQPSATPAPTRPGPSPTLPPTATATPVPTPIPESMTLTGLVHEYQQMNNCGPATLAMLLSYWGWQGDQRDTRAVLRPKYASIDDKNVMPAEMAAYITAHTGLEALVRVGGEVETLKRLIAAGFPVIVEKGFQPPKEAWMGHYGVLNGYDDARQRFMSQDSYIMADFPVPYAELSERWWRDFNYVYLVAYPPERQAEVLAVLGPDADLDENYRRAAERALAETAVLGGRDLYFAWFNRGTNLTALGEYTGAAAAYDQAFSLYANLPEAERPWRMLWYQTGPYEAYYQTGRYQDVINLANTTLSFLSQPILEETLYWRAMAKEALGDLPGAIKDYTRAATINPTSTGAADALARLGAPVP